MTDHKELRRLAAAVQRFSAPWEHTRGGIWCPSEKGGHTKFIDIRGWGYLTGGGHGALGLPSEEAAAIQDALGDYVAAIPPQAVTALLEELADSKRRHEITERQAGYMAETLGGRLEKAEAERDQLITAVRPLIERDPMIVHGPCDPFVRISGDEFRAIKKAYEALATPHTAATPYEDAVDKFMGSHGDSFPFYQRDHARELLLRFLQNFNPAKHAPADSVQVRTPGTVEVCQLCKQPIDGSPPGLCWRTGVRYSLSAFCPMRPTSPDPARATGREGK